MLLTKFPTVSNKNIPIELYRVYPSWHIKPPDLYYITNLFLQQTIKVMRKNDEIGYGSFVEKELRRVVAIKLSVKQGGFREESVFFGGRRDTPTPHPLDILPRIVGHFRICDNIPVASDRGSIFFISSSATEDHRADSVSHNILHQVGGCAGCSRVETRTSGTGSGRAGKRQEVSINIRTGTHCAQPSTHRVLVDL